MIPFKRILCPTDFSAPSLKAIDQAKALAALCSAEIFLLQVTPPVTVLPGASVDPDRGEGIPRDRSVAFLEKSLKALMEEKFSPELQAYPVVLVGRDPAEQIVKFAEEKGIDLIVIASHGQSGWKRLVFGSVTQKVLREASCSVLLVQAPH